jgi:hypothetical protein
MKVKYIGPYADGVFVPAIDQDVPAAGVVDVSDELGCSLCEQEATWEPADKAAAKTFADFCAWVAAVLSPPAQSPSTPAAAAVVPQEG